MPFSTYQICINKLIYHIYYLIGRYVDYLTQIYKSADDKRGLFRLVKRNELDYEMQLVPVRDENGKLLGIYGTGRDVTEVAKSYSLQQENIKKLKSANEEMQDYIRNIDYVLKNGGVRMANYSTDTHAGYLQRDRAHPIPYDPDACSGAGGRGVERRYAARA